jgi:hypothetical protein
MLTTLLQSLIIKLIPKLTTVFKTIKNNLSIVFIVISVLLGGVAWYQSKKINMMDQQVAGLNSNLIELSHDRYSRENDNRVLTLKLGDLSQYNDSLLHNIDSLQNTLKMAKNSLKQATAIQEVLRDTFVTEITNENTNNTTNIDSVRSDICDFCTVITPNELTTIQVCKEGDSLTVMPSIRNELYVYIGENKVYRNRRKNWLSRLFHWDWKKDRILNYEIVNTNPLITIEKARVINLDD